MSYKEVHVPSEKIRQIYEPLLKELEGILKQSEVKFEENVKLKEENRRKEEEAVLELYGRFSYYSGYWNSMGYLYTYENPVVRAIAVCNTMLDAASLNDTVVMTENQIQEMNRKDQILEFCKEWLVETPYLDTTYQDLLKREKEAQELKEQNKPEEPAKLTFVDLVDLNDPEPIPEKKRIPVFIWMLLSAGITAAFFCFI